MYFFAADEHYGHQNIIRYCDRPFASVQEMDDELVRRHNLVVGKGDIVVHGGDFTLAKSSKAQEYIARLNGQHVFIQGSHDRWLDRSAQEVWQRKVQDHYVVVCHYAMRVWPASHYNSWQLFGHSHGLLDPIGKQWDIGVDANDFTPLSYSQLVEIMAERPDNPDLIPTP